MASFFVFVQLFLLIHGVKGWLHEGNLIDFLLNSTRYSSKYRPVLYQNTSVEVRQQLVLKQILKVDEKSQVLTTNVWIKMQWTDIYLKWDPSNYGGVKQINIDASSLWTPQIILYNNAHDAGDDPNPRAMVRSDGSVTLIKPAILQSSCEINVKYFPLDEQVCKLTFGSWNYDITKLYVKPAHREVDTTQYSLNGEWDLRGTWPEERLITHPCCNSKVSEISYVIHIKRLSLFYVTSFIVPCALVAVLTVLVFLTPEDTGERMALAVTYLLALAVFFLMVEVKLPVSPDLPLIAKYYCCTIIEASCGLVAMCSVLRFVHSNPEPLPEWVQKYILGYTARLTCYDTGEPKQNVTKIKVRASEDGGDPERGTNFAMKMNSDDDIKKSERFANKWLKKVKERKAARDLQGESRGVKILADDVREQQKSDEMHDRWVLTANVLNRFFMLVFVFSIFVTLVAVFMLDKPEKLSTHAHT